MKIYYCSDVHLEFGTSALLLDQFRVGTKEDILVLAGDIVPERYVKKHLDFFETVSAAFGQVFYIPGNHEFYHGYFNKSIGRIKNLLADYSNILFDDCFTMNINGIQFVAATLWTDLGRNPTVAELCRFRMNDYKDIVHDVGNNYRKLRPDDTVSRHFDHMAFLRRHVTSKSIVITHHAPSFLSIPDTYAGDLSNYAYATELADFILEKKPKAWIHGHIHERNNYFLESTQVLSNPRGYFKFETDDRDFKLLSVEYV